MFRVDRIREPRLVGTHFAPREIPGGDAADFVARSLGSTPREVEATLAVQATRAELAGVLRWFDHTVIEADTERCVVRIRSEDVGRLAMVVARIGLAAPVTVIDPAELVDVVKRLATHLGAPEAGRPA